MLVTQSCPTLCNPPGPFADGKEYWSGQPFPSPGDLLDPGMEPGSPALAGGLSFEPPESKMCMQVAQSCLTPCDPHGL